jgi:hypothetical protein
MRESRLFLEGHRSDLASIPGFALGVRPGSAFGEPLHFGEEPGGVCRKLLVHEIPRWSPRRIRFIRFRLISLHIWFDPAPRRILRRGLGRLARGAVLKWLRRRADDEAVALVTPSYDPRVIEQFAEKLYRKASAFVVGSIVIGGAVGAAFGAVPLTSLGEAWPIPSAFGVATLLLGALLGGVVGYVVGDTRAFGYRLQAQAALCQLQTERNTALIAAVAAASRAAPQQAPPREQPATPPVTPPVTARVA